MATYRLSAKTIGRSSGRSSTGAAAYRAAQRIVDRRTGIVHDYARRSGVAHSEILVPANAPKWAYDRSDLWNRVEEVERRKDAQLCREVLVSLPHELDDARRTELVREFVRDAFISRGMVADIAIHRAHRQSDERNHHAHILLTMRTIGPKGFAEKERTWNDRSILAEWRQDWEQCVNRELERARIPERVSCRSLAAREIDREPEPRQGPVATKMERSGRQSHAGDDRRAVKARNTEREQLREDHRRIDALLREENRRRVSQEHEIGRAQQNQPGIQLGGAPPWQLQREQVLSALYEADVRGSRLARYWRISRTNEGLAFENARGCFEDRGARIVARAGNDLEIRGMLDLAELKNWKELVFTGTEGFKREAMAAALDRGLVVRAEGRDLELLRDVERARGRDVTPERARAHERRDGWSR